MKLQTDTITLANEKITLSSVYNDHECGKSISGYTILSSLYLSDSSIKNESNHWSRSFRVREFSESMDQNHLVNGFTWRHSAWL